MQEQNPRPLVVAPGCPAPAARLGQERPVEAHTAMDEWLAQDKKTGVSLEITQSKRSKQQKASHVAHSKSICL